MKKKNPTTESTHEYPQTFEEFKLNLDSIRDKLSLSTEFRQQNETSIIYKHIPDAPNGERFLGNVDNEGLVASLVKTVSTIAIQNSQEDVANILKNFYSYAA